MTFAAGYRAGGRPLSATLLVVVLVAAATVRAWAESPDVPTGWPLPSSAAVLRPFDPPAQPWGRGHRGVDLAAGAGDRVLATADGRVSFAGTLAGRGVVVVDHGETRTTYEPVTATVAVGTRVRRGDAVGRVAGGRHCGARSCLHWGLRRGLAYLDPLGAARADPARPSGHVRLLPASARAVAERRAAVRAAARAVARAAELAAATTGGPTAAALRLGSGHHGFLHPVAGRITSPYGRRFHPVLHVWKLHDGTDFGAPCGTPIRAPYPGVVTRAANSPAYGHRLFLDHGRVDGRHVVTSYNHATRYVVRRGTRVARGQVIGYVGATGYATGCHLHLMVWLNGRRTNPMSWL